MGLVSNASLGHASASDIPTVSKAASLKFGFWLGPGISHEMAL
jgi:hypothetical protein